MKTAHESSLHDRLRPLSASVIALLMSILAGHVFASDAMTAELKPATLQAWDKYFTQTDERVKKELSDSNRFLIEDFLSPKDKANARRQVEAGGVFVRGMHVNMKVPDGEIHHWWGTILVPGVTLAQLLSFLQDYEHHAGRFTDVERSKLLSRKDNYFRFYFRLKRTKAFVTAYYNTEQECDYFANGKGRASSRSIATKIAEIENPGSPAERERPPGNDRGFLWRLVSWWRFEESDKGVIVECESASLSRDIPLFIKAIPPIADYIRSTPRESLESVLKSIRTHVPKH